MIKKQNIYDLLINNIEELLSIIKTSFYGVDNLNIIKKTKAASKRISVYNIDLELKVISFLISGFDSKIQIEIKSTVENKNLLYEFYPNNPEKVEYQIHFFVEKENYNLTISDYLIKHFTFEYYTNDQSGVKHGLENIHIALDYNFITDQNKLKRARALKKSIDHFEFVGERSLTERQKNITNELIEIIQKENINLSKLILNDTEYLRQVQSIVDKYELLTDSHVLYDFIFNTGLTELIKNEDLSFKRIDNSLKAKLKGFISNIINNKKPT